MRNQQLLVASCTFSVRKAFFDPSNRVIITTIQALWNFQWPFIMIELKIIFIWFYSNKLILGIRTVCCSSADRLSEQSYLISDCLKQICHIFVASASASIMPLREARVLKTAWSHRACCLFLPILRQLQSLKLHKWLRIRYRKYSFFLIFSWSDKYRIFNALLKKSNTNN